MYMTGKLAFLKSARPNRLICCIRFFPARRAKSKIMPFQIFKFCCIILCCIKVFASFDLFFLQNLCLFCLTNPKYQGVLCLCLYKFMQSVFFSSPNYCKTFQNPLKFHTIRHLHLNKYSKGLCVAMNYTSNETILKWIAEMSALTTPEKVVWIDGSEQQLETLRKVGMSTGEMIKLNEETNPAATITAAHSTMSPELRTELSSAAKTRKTPARQTTGWTRRRCTPSSLRYSKAQWRDAPCTSSPNRWLNRLTLCQIRH